MLPTQIVINPVIYAREREKTVRRSHNSISRRIVAGLLLVAVLLLGTVLPDEIVILLPLLAIPCVANML